MGNRAMRRQMAREQSKKNRAMLEGLSRDEKIAGLIKNGISGKDLEDAWEDGRLEGFRQAAIPIFKSCYAGIILALHDEFGFGQERCYRAIRACDEKILFSLNHSELAEEVLQKTGLEFKFDEPFDRIAKVEKHREEA